MIVHSSDSELGRKIKDAARDAGLTLMELGSRLGVSRPTIYAYAAGTLKISDSRLEQIAKTLGLPVTYFMPSAPEHLSERSSTAHALKLIDALMSPASPERASEAAIGALTDLQEASIPGIRAELLRRSGNALALTGRFNESVRQLEDARDLLESLGDEAKLGACYQTLGFCYTSLGRLDRAQICFDSALALLPPDQVWKAKVANAALSERRTDFDTAEAQLSQLLDDHTLSEQALSYVRANYASIVCTRGRWRSGYAQTETALNAAYAANLTDQIAEMLIQGSIALTHLGKFPEATLMVTRAKDVAFSLQDESRATLAEVTIGRLLMEMGEHERARVVTSKAYSRALRGQFKRSESQAMMVLCELANYRGDAQTAYELAEQAFNHAHAHGLAVEQFQAQLLMVRAIVSGNLPEKINQLVAEITQLAQKCPESQIEVAGHEARALNAMFNHDVQGAQNELQVAIKKAETLGLHPYVSKLEKTVGARLHNKRADDTLSQHHAQNRLWIQILNGESLQDLQESKSPEGKRL